MLRVMLVSVLLGCSVPAIVEAQGGIMGRIKRRVQENVERKVDEMVDCAFDDRACQDRARAEGKTVRIDSARAPRGAPTADTAATSGGGGASGAASMASSAVWANYDFQPGERTLFFEDYRTETIGDFPRRFEFVDGNLELVTYRDRPWVRFATTGRMFVPIGRTLPQRFTLEIDFWGESSGECWLYLNGEMTGDYRAEFGSYAVAGLVTPRGTAENRGDAQNIGRLHTARYMFDGTYGKAYVDSVRGANVPNFDTTRANRLGFFCDAGMAVGTIRVAEGGRKLYDAIVADGRVAMQGIYFDTGSDRLRPESAPTLREIAAMLIEHPTLRLAIEGHTDDVGAAATNLDLSRRRAVAVLAALTSQYRADASRLTSAGRGSTQPVAPNTTPEGRQQNRRVELVKVN